MSRNIGFGIDFAGYTTGKTSIAFVKIDGDKISATLLRNSALSRKRKTTEALADVVPQEARIISQCLEVACVAVDVPIDLQGLPYPSNAQVIWQLTRRPVDQAIGAMPPLADRIGAPVARFAAIMRVGNFERELGKKLFEAYPAGTLRLLEIEAGAYKGPNGLDALKALCSKLNVQGEIESDDDIDAQSLRRRRLKICTTSADLLFRGPCRRVSGFRLGWNFPPCVLPNVRSMNGSKVRIASVWIHGT